MTWIICAILAIVLSWIVFVVDNRVGTGIAIDRWKTGHLLAVVIGGFAGGPAALVISFIFAAIFAIWLLVTTLNKDGFISNLLDKDL